MLALSPVLGELQALGECAATHAIADPPPGQCLCVPAMSVPQRQTQCPSLPYFWNVLHDGGPVREVSVHQQVLRQHFQWTSLRNQCQIDTNAELKLLHQKGQIK
jgi:hypothetical protein